MRNGSKKLLSKATQKKMKGGREAWKSQEEKDRKRKATDDWIQRELERKKKSPYGERKGPGDH